MFVVHVYIPEAGYCVRFPCLSFVGFVSKKHVRNVTRLLQVSPKIYLCLLLLAAFRACRFASVHQADELASATDKQDEAALAKRAAEAEGR